jgi:hypothetical protein
LKQQKQQGDTDQISYKKAYSDRIYIKKYYQINSQIFVYQIYFFNLNYGYYHLNLISQISLLIIKLLVNRF